MLDTMAEIDASAGKPRFSSPGGFDDNDAQNRACPRDRSIAAGVAAPTILAWPAGAAEFVYKYGPRCPMGIRWSFARAKRWPR
jgi:hypothetical protein